MYLSIVFEKLTKFFSGILFGVPGCSMKIQRKRYNIGISITPYSIMSTGCREKSQKSLAAVGCTLQWTLGAEINTQFQLLFATTLTLKLRHSDVIVVW